MEKEEMTKQERVAEFTGLLSEMSPELTRDMYRYGEGMASDALEVLDDSIMNFIAIEDNQDWALKLADLLIEYGRDDALSSSIYISSSIAPRSRKAAELLWIVLPGKVGDGKLLQALVEEQTRTLKVLPIELYPLEVLGKYAERTEELRLILND